MKTMIQSFATLISILCFPNFATAHVKWFTRSTDDRVASLADLNHPSFWFLLGLSVMTLGVIVYADTTLERWSSYQKFNRLLESYSDRATMTLRVFTGASLLLAWEADSMIAPELKTSGLVGWFQFALVLLLLLRTTTPIAGAGMIGLYFYAMKDYGFFHLLDYLVYPAIGYFFIAASFQKRKISQTRIPALYIGLGFSLCWAALEKVFFPHWGLDVLKQQPGLTMGLPPDFFLLACAFIELCLGYLLIIGVLQRPLALTITIVFVLTSAFFGKTEVIGHTILHGALIVFTIIGPGNYYPAPIELLKRQGLRATVAALNFVVVVGLLGLAYHWMATEA